jgi:hypothetical protein
MVLALSLGYTLAAIPFVTTLPATAVGTNQATMNGFVDPRGSFTTVWFEFGPTTAYGSTTPQQFTDFLPQNFSHPLTGLSNGLTYHYRAVAFADGFFAFGGDQSFTTGPDFANVAWYRLGENDPAAANGAAVPTTTFDVIGANHLKQYGSPIYTGAISADASNRIGSFLGVQFNGTSQYVSNAVVSTAIDNFGIEAWVKPNNVNAGVRIIACNGNTAANGWGILQNGGAYLGLLGGVVTVGDGTAPAVVGTWAHVALARHNGTTTLYLNGVAAGTTASAPIPPSGGFTLATRAQQPTSEFFNGAIDEVRVFRFQPGQFNTNRLLLHVQRVATLAATGVTSANATLRGSADPLGLPTTAWFEWGPTTTFGNLTFPRTLEGGFGNSNFSEVVGQLIGGNTYHFRAAASNAAGIVTGTRETFTTTAFSDVGAGLPGVVFSSIAWGDYDNDGRLDLLITGSTNNPQSGQVNGFISQIWRNTGAGFSNINAGLPGVLAGPVAWGDYDNDGRLDFVLSGASELNTLLQAVRFAGDVWRNTGSGFTNINARLPQVYLGSHVWGDYDNDGKLDLLIYGQTTTNLIAEVWRNTGNGFSNINAGLVTLGRGSVAWGDYDNDGWLDILVTGVSSSQPRTQIWRNTGSGFTNINAGLRGVWFGGAAWGDYDNDGRLDILLWGASVVSVSDASPAAPVTEVWRNTGSGFTNINVGLPGIVRGAAAWGDYDNDGRLDILLNGGTSFTVSINATGFVSQVWRNTGAGFSNINESLPGLAYGGAIWGDYDNDGRLDFVMSGTASTDLALANYPMLIRKNNLATTNTAPVAPTGLAAGAAGNIVTLSWNTANDNQTPANGLRYNVRIGTAPGASDVLSPMSAANGSRRLPEMGTKRQFALFSYRLGTPYYWSVQAIDTAFAGSPFAAEHSFKVLQVPQPPPVVTAVATTNVVYGDVNGDGVLDQQELKNVLAPYWQNSPWLQMTNLAGLGGSNVTFALSNSTAGAFSVEYSTNLIDWYFLGPATPRYLFEDTNAPTQPLRYYRLRWP